MRSKERFTNLTFTKRVDHEAGRRRPRRAATEPRICFECAAVYVKRRWSRAETAPEKEHQNEAPPIFTLCPACKQKHEGAPQGFVFLDGGFLQSHEQEIEQLLENEANYRRCVQR